MKGHVLVASVILAAALGATAAPIPPGGAFAYKGQPTFISGFYRGLEPTQVGTYLASVDGYILERFFKAPDGSSGGEIVLGRVSSFQCLDDTTYISIVNYTSYALRSDGLPTVSPRSICALRRLEGDVLRTVLAHIDGKDGHEPRCPDVSDLPTTDATTVNGLAKSSFKRVPSGINLPAVMCVNQSLTQGWDGAPPLPSEPPSLPSGTPCATYPSPGGPPITGGIWNLPDGLDMGIETPKVWSDSEWSQDPKQIGGSVGIYTSHRCVDKSTAQDASFVQKFYLNGTVGQYWSCATKTRISEAGKPDKLHIKGGGIDETFTLVQELPGSPTTVCAVSPTPSPSPKPPISPSPKPKPPAPSGQTCTWRGLWKISAAAAPCSRSYLTHAASNCSNASVALRLRPAVSAQPQRLEWGLNHSYNRKTKIATSANIKAIKNYCPAVNLSGPRVPKDPPLYLRIKAGFKFRIIPVSPTSCTEVYLKAVKGPQGRDYLTVPSSCNNAAWASKRSTRAIFRLTKVSELLP